jgi:hypothetical protein
MADINSSLPVRTENPGDVVVKVSDATTPSQQLAIDSSGRVVVKLDDGSGNPITSQANGSQQALDVGINVGGVQIDPRQIRALTSSDVVTANQGTAAALAGAWPVLLTDGTNSASITAAGEIKADITQPLPAGTNLIGKATISQGGNDAAVTASNALKVDGSAVTQPVSGTVTANQGGAPWSQNLTQILGAAPSATNALPAQLATAGAYVSPSNPLPVTVAPAGGSPICDYNDAASIAAGSSDNHDYTVTAGKTLYLEQVEASASGKAKALVSIETGVGTNVFSPVAAMFNSTATPNMSIMFTNPLVVAAGVRVRVAMTNRDNQAEDLYSSIMGYEI